VHCLPPGPSPVGLPLPADFIVAAAIRCVETERVLPGLGVWQFELRQVAAGPLHVEELGIIPPRSRPRLACNCIPEDRAARRKAPACTTGDGSDLGFISGGVKITVLVHGGARSLLAVVVVLTHIDYDGAEID
jgi:hypothetical protein